MDYIRLAITSLFCYNTYMKKDLIIRIIYGFGALGFLLYLITKNSEFMFFGGVFLIIASTLFIINKKEK